MTENEYVDIGNLRDSVRNWKPTDHKWKSLPLPDTFVVPCEVELHYVHVVVNL